MNFPVIGLSIGVPAIKGMERIRLKYKVNKQKWLEIFGADKSLVDAYDVYDCLMNYWGETMQDDCYMISSGGWTVQLYTPQPASKKNDDKKKKEKKAATPEDIVCDLLPVPIVVDEYFADKRNLIVAAEELLSQNEAQLAELIEEQAENYLDEDNFLDGKMTDANIKKRIKALDKKADAEELRPLYAEFSGRLTKDNDEIPPEKGLPLNLDSGMLVKALESVLKRMKVAEALKHPTELVNPLIKHKVVSVEEKIEEICALLEEHEEASLFFLLKDACDRPELVARFMGILELIKINRIKSNSS